MYKPPRLYTHIVLLVVTVVATAVTKLLLPLASWFYVTTLATGYLSFALVTLTLVIGTVRLFQRRKNPVNIDLRRDVGIWAGTTGIVHALLGFGVFSGNAILPYFVRWTDDGDIRLLTDLFGLNNYTGTAAAVILVALLLTSNQVSLIWLKGKRWKTLQRWNYAMAILIVIHTLGYQHLSDRATIMKQLTGALILVALIAQGIGFWMTRRRLNHDHSARQRRDRSTVASSGG